jgi:hypothetical protein
VSYIVSWDGPSAREPERGHEVQVSTVDDLDQVLDQVAAQAAAENLPYAVQVYHPDAQGSIMIGIGHEERSFVDWLIPKGYRKYGRIDTVPAPDQPIAFDVYGDWHEHEPEQSRITPDTAREAVREFVRTGGQPTCVEWVEPPTA